MSMIESEEEKRELVRSLFGAMLKSEEEKIGLVRSLLECYP